MEINWFTFFAEIVNFLILLAILQKVLYRPIIQVMEQRDKYIRDRLQSAEQKMQEAQQEAENYRQKQQEWTQQQQERLTQAKAEIEQLRQTLMENIREEIKANEIRWQSALERQKEAFLRELRDRAVQQIQETIRRILADLADVTLEERLIEVFIERIRNSESELLCQLAAPTDQDGEIVVYSSYDIPEHSQQAIIRILNQQLPNPINPRFETTSDLICGIELRATGCKLAWSLENYLDSLENNLSAALEEGKEK